MALVDIPVQAGGWFKPKEAAGAVAILLDVHSFERQRPTPNGPKDSILADVAVFRDDASLALGLPEVAKGQRIEQTVLARDLETVVGNSTIVTLDQVPPTKPGAHPAWVWRPATDAKVRQAVIEYMTAREAAADAAVAEAPDFD
ncbi:hypothetical protein [Streptodolium elevatio]|uniref:Uncharacterized protein n=1 Tax=Streptodolium elevatio TaxID=3157996 RepID=A0ABV3DBU5_9ACTN